LTFLLSSIEVPFADDEGICGNSESRPKKRNRATAQPRNRAIVQGVLSPQILTIQNTADLEFPAINPDNAAERDEFLLNTFPPDNHVPPAPPPAPQQTPPAK
jgi:hypothetical protein